MGDRLPAFLRDHECCGLVWGRGFLFVWDCAGFFYAGDETIVGGNLRRSGRAIGDRAVFHPALLLRRAGVASSIGRMGLPGQGVAAADVRVAARDPDLQSAGGVLASAKIKGTLPDQAWQGEPIHRRTEK